MLISGHEKVISSLGPSLSLFIIWSIMLCRPGEFITPTFYGFTCL
ncbi:hypothetical protein Hanom_Chr04g00338891 [Helianthus anomalus]